jgi:hypothetical protein
MDNITLLHWVGSILLILVIITICIVIIIYYTTVGQEKVLRGLDLVLLKLRRKNFITMLTTLPSKETVDIALKEVRDLEVALEKPEKDFSKELENYYKIKKEVDERGYI